MHLPIRPAALGAVAAAVLVIVGCSSDAEVSEADPDARLAAAADLLDETTGVRFVVEGTDLPRSGTVITGAEGHAAPPSSFEGEITVLTAGLAAGIEVVSIDGALWAKLPLTAEFAVVDADTLGFADPGRLLDADHGVSRLLRSASGLSTGESVRAGSEVFDQIAGVLPGDLVGSVLTIADPDATVDVVFALDRDTGHLRQATLTGPFYPGGDNQTYTVHLDDYDASVDIGVPDD